MTPTAKETDPLDHLELRIQKAVALVARLREEKEALAQQREVEALEALREQEILEQKLSAALLNAANDKEDTAKAIAQEREAASKVADALRVDLEEARIANAALSLELEAMREERQQVRGRLEKLLSHIDQLGAA